MKGFIWDLRRIAVLVIACLLQPAGAAYEAQAKRCIKSRYSDFYRSLQQSISFNATPYPFVTKDTNVTLSCSGRVVDLESKQGEQPYMTSVEFRKNNIGFHWCRVGSYKRRRSLSCSVTVTGIAINDSFVCIVKGTRGPCNAAQITFSVENRAGPKISNLLPVFKHDFKKFEVTCNTTGIPEPSVRWLLNGSMFNYTNFENRKNVEVFTRRRNDENETRLFHVISTIVTNDRTFPLRIQCAAKNAIDEVFSENIYVIQVEVIKLRLTTTTIRWFAHPDITKSFLDGSGYNVSIFSRNISSRTIRFFKKSSATFSNLTIDRRYTVYIEAFTKKRDLVIGAIEFYSPDRLPKPRDVNLAKITSQKAVIKWKMLSLNKTTQGAFMGYEVLLIGKNRTMNLTLESNKRSIVLRNLIPKSKYTIVIRGFTQYGKGDVLEYHFATLDLIPRPQNVKVISILENSAVVQWNIIPQNLEKYDKIIGYRVIIQNETSYVQNITTSSDNFFVALTDLSPNTDYEGSLVAVSDETEGVSSEFSFKTRGPQSESKVASEKVSDSTVTVSVVTVVVVVGVITVLTTVAVKRFRRRRAMKLEKMKANQVITNNVNRSFNDNIRILYPEYYNDDPLNASEELPYWEISRGRLAVLDNVLGGGYFGLVKEGVFMQLLSNNASEKISVAVKTLKANRGQNDWNELLREFEILKHVNSSTGHQNVVKVFGACTQTVPILLVMEFCSKGNLKDLLTSSRIDDEANRNYSNIYSKFTERQLINFGVEIARGMVFLFEKKVVHRDIASRNILLNDTFVPKIADFGLARKIDDTAHYIVNKNRMLPVKWMSIESLEEGRFTPASDIWSYGVLLWEICTLAEEPYKDVSPYDMLEYLYEGHRMSRPSYCSIEIFSLMERCWQRVPEERPSFKEIYKTLQSMLIDNEKSYVNVQPYHDLNETMISTLGDILKEDCRETDSNSDVAISEEGPPQDSASGVLDTAF